MVRASGARSPFSIHTDMTLTIAKLIICIMLASLYLNRSRSHSIIRPNQPALHHSSPSESLLSDGDRDLIDDSIPNQATRSRKSRRCCGLSIDTTDTSRFAKYPQSRLLQKFPFLVEMFYWALNYVAYALTKKAAAAIYGGGNKQVTTLAQENGIRVLDMEHHSSMSVLFAIHEADLQAYFITHHKPVMTLFNQIYSLVHIPGTVAYVVHVLQLTSIANFKASFLSWYYYAAPSHSTFAVARRTMTLGNFAAFFIFCFYPCMPPRLLPKSFGFKDTVRQGHAESVWAGGNNVNELAAMPSLHFTYAFIVGCTFFYQSGVLQIFGRKRGTPPQRRRSVFGTVTFMVMGLLYPVLVLAVIVATANHYWLDAVVATFSVAVSFACNRVLLVLLPAEQVLCWALKIQKPVPTTGQRCGNETELQRRRKSSVVQISPM